MRPDARRRPDLEGRDATIYRPDHTASGAAVEAFRWARCPRHPWLGVSVILSAGHPALCVLPGSGFHLAAMGTAS